MIFSEVIKYETENRIDQALKKTLLKINLRRSIREYLKYINADYDLVIKKLTAINKNTKVKD